MRLRHKAIPKEGGKGVRVLSIPTIRDRVVQGAFKLILEPIFEADFQPGSYGYRPKRSAHDAVLRVAEAIVKYKTRVIDVDLQAYFDNIRHHSLVAKVAQRVNDPDVLHVLKLMLKASGKKGVAQGGVMPMGIFWHCIIDPCRGLSVPNVLTCHVAPATISCTTFPPFVVCTLPDPLWWCHDAWVRPLSVQAMCTSVVPST